MPVRSRGALASIQCALVSRTCVPARVADCTRLSRDCGAGTGATAPARNDAYATPPTRIGNQNCAMRYVSTVTVAVAAGTPKPTSVGM